VGRLAVAALVAAVAVASPAHAAAALPTHLTGKEAARNFLADGKVRSWLRHYPRVSWVTTETFRDADRRWRIDVYSGPAGEVATGLVDDATGLVVEAWTGPQVAWPLARDKTLGGPINHPSIWLAFCAVFFLGLANLRRPLSMRNVDLLALLSFSVPLFVFNHGHVFAGVLLTAIPLAYLIARCLVVGCRGRGTPRWVGLPAWILVAGTLVLVGFRINLNLHHSGVLDVGYAGVIGADRIDRLQDPYGHFPQRDTGTPCGPPNLDGYIGDWVQSDGRCETAHPLGDTYGPVTYMSYLPGLWILGWTGKWDRLPAAHFTTIAFDLLALLGMAAVGYRFGGVRLAAALGLAWAAYPFTQYVSSSNTNDAIPPALLVWGFWAASRDTPRGLFTGLAAWTKLAALIVVPLWLTYPHAEPRRRHALVAFAATTVLAFWVLLLGNPLHEAHVFWERTFVIQFDRRSPFSLWDWGQYHIDLPDLKWLQHVLQVVLACGALAAAFVPRRKSPLQLAALTCALLAAFELLLTHWSVLYIAWFFPFAVFALVAGESLRVTADASRRTDEPVSSPAPADASAA
jgi:hypothetical protein